MKPLIPLSRRSTVANTELVFLLRPRIVAFIPGDEDDTPPIVDAPRSGQPVSAMSGEVGRLFGSTAVTAPAAEPARPKTEDLAPVAATPVAVEPETPEAPEAPPRDKDGNGAEEGDMAPSDIPAGMAPTPLAKPQEDKGGASP
jgi:hypothetical protein